MTTLTQRDRLMHIDTPLGGDVLLVRSFTAEEAMSKLFHYKLVLVSEQHDIDFKEVLKKPATLSIRHSDGTSHRFFSGIISRFSQQPEPGRLAVYHAEMVPWLWLLTLTADCLIYQNQTVPDVIAATFDRYGFRDYKMNLVGKHDPWEYCTQYRESSYAFVARLMELEGMYYYFEHEDGKHTLIITDHRSKHQPCPYQSEFRYEKVVGAGYKHSDDTVHQWVPDSKVCPAKFTHRDFNFETPEETLEADIDAIIEAVLEAVGLADGSGGAADSKADDSLEVYEYPGEYEQRDEAQDWARLRIEEQELPHDAAEGEGNCRSMIPGYRFQLTDHFRQDQNRPYLITRVSHRAHEGTLFGGTDEGEAHYENDFSVMPAATQYRTPRNTKKHQMLGSQTAFVVGPPGEEIHTDQYGRVRVKFHWDRKPGRAEDSSCWIRIMHPWTGHQWGHQWIPRIGQEVIVDFLEGDPDRPIITGSVYNQDNLPPYTLPAKKTVSGIRTHSTKGGGDQNYNEIRFEDNIGQELLSLQAERDMYRMIKHDEATKVMNDQSVEIGNDRSKKVAGDQRLEVDGEQHEWIKKDQKRTVEGDERERVLGDYSLNVDGDIVIASQGGQSFHITGDSVGQVGGDRNSKVDGDDQLKITGDLHIEVDGEIHLKGKKIVIHASDQAALKGPGGFVEIGPGGITIKGTHVLINSGGSAPDADGADPGDPDDPEEFEKDPYRGRNDFGQRPPD